MTNTRMVEQIAPTVILAPSSQTGGQATPGHMLDTFRKRLYTLVVGAMANGATVDMKIQASTDGTGNGAGAWVDVPGIAIATLTAPNVAQIEIQADRVQALNLGQYVRCVVTVTGGACLTCLLGFAGNGRYKPASDYNLAGMPAAVLL